MRVLAASMLAGAAAAGFFDGLSDIFSFDLDFNGVSYSEYEDKSPGEQLVFCSDLWAQFVDSFCDSKDDESDCEDNIKDVFGAVYELMDSDN